MTGMQRLEAAQEIVKGLPGNTSDQLTIVMLAMAMTMRLASIGDEEAYARLVQAANRLMAMAPPVGELETVELH